MAETVLVTGASLGIGLELARCFAADGSRLVLVARSAERLESLAAELRERHGVEVRVLPADLADPAAPERIAAELRDAGIEVDVLVNNAGFGARGPVAEIPLERQMEMIQVNIAALTHLTRLFLPGMLLRRRGGVLNVGSTAAFQPGPYMSIYYASKAYVLFFTEGLVEELSGTGVTASCLAPGPTRTGFEEAANMQGARLFRLGTMSARRVARAGFEGFRAGKPLVIPGPRNRIGAEIMRRLPLRLARRITAMLQE